MRGRVPCYRMELETLSPVRVGAGQEAVLSPYTDFVQEGGHLVYLDPRKMERALDAQPAGIMDEFVRGVRSRMNNTRSDFELGEFIGTRLASTPAALALRRVPVRGTVGHAQVRRHVSNGGQPYVPGSTLKGAIRTSILYCWLVDEPEGRRFVEEMAGKVEGLWREHGARLDEAEQLYRQGRRDEGDRIAGSIPYRAREGLADFSERRLFGDPGDRRRGAEMRFLRLSDTAPFPAGALEVAEVRRIKLFGAEMGPPQWSEVLPRGSKTTFSLSVEPRFTLPGLRFLNKDPVQPLLERLDRFADACLEWELDVLDDLSDVAALDGIYAAETELEKRDPLPRAARMRLGAGKTYFDNSLGLALRGHDGTVFERFRRLLGLGRNPRFRRFSDARFPATRSFVTDRGTPVEPLGWVQVSAAG